MVCLGIYNELPTSLLLGCYEVKLFLKLETRSEGTLRITDLFSNWKKGRQRQCNCFSYWQLHTYLPKIPLQLPQRNVFGLDHASILKNNLLRFLWWVDWWLSKNTLEHFPWKTPRALQIHHRSLAGTLQSLEQRLF